METVFDYKDLSDFISRTKVIESMPEGRAIIVIGYMDDIPFPLPGFSSDLSKLDFQIQEEGYHYWLEMDKHLTKPRFKVKYQYDPHNDPFKGLPLLTASDFISRFHQPLMPSDCFKLRDCPVCKQITAQEQKFYNPDYPGKGMVWHCTKCKENIDLV